LDPAFSFSSEFLETKQTQDTNFFHTLTSLSLRTPLTKQEHSETRAPNAAFSGTMRTVTLIFGVKEPKTQRFWSKSKRSEAERTQTPHRALVKQSRHGQNGAFFSSMRTAPCAEKRITLSVCVCVSVSLFLSVGTVGENPLRLSLSGEVRAVLGCALLYLFAFQKRTQTANMETA
jgi:hypothetical protein